MHIDSRKHGPFDSRWPSIRHAPAPATLWRVGEERLDWHAFLARFFPGSSRHDFEALAAYELYGNDAARTAEEPAPEGTERWESEGGASARPRHRRAEATSKAFA